jgi:hypothetical protein
VEKTMSIRDEPHYRISSSELAAWLEAQGEDIWWNVDGDDALLSGRLRLPAPADELAAKLRKINRTLLVEDQRDTPCGRGETITARDLDGLVTRLGDNIILRKGPRPLWMSNRTFALAWEGLDDEWWMLNEDQWLTQAEREDALAAEEEEK